MKNRISIALCAICLISITACSQEEKPELEENLNTPIVEVAETNQEPHKYGGWYCPDNLNGFPAVDLADWKDVPVVNGRLCTKEESQNGTSLIFVDTAEYPNAKPLDIKMPQLASIFNHSSQREETIIILQAVNIQNDSIVGFRYLNGGNGSARLDEIKIINENEAKENLESRFVSIDIEIKATQEEVWKVITNEANSDALQPTVDDKWRAKTNVNYHYENSGTSTALFANLHFGCYYVQNDFENGHYNEKFFVSEDQETKESMLKISCGPFTDDFEEQKEALNKWGQKVKELSEK